MKSHDRRRGMVLVTVLWSIALLSALAMAASTTFRGFAGIMVVERDKVQAEALLSAGLEIGAGIVGHLGDAPLDGIETHVMLSAGAVGVRLSDEGGRIDIGKAPVEVLAALFRAVGAEEADDIAQRIVAWRKADEANRSGAAPGAPNNAASDQPPKDGSDKKPAADLPFTDVRQLAQIPGIAPEWVTAIAPLTTVFGNDKVNPRTAPAEVIAVLPGVEPGQIRAFVDLRRTVAADETTRLVSMLGGAQPFLEVKPQHAVSVQIAVQLADGYKADAWAVIMAAPKDNLPYRVLVWNPLPSSR